MRGYSSVVVLLAGTALVVASNFASIVEFRSEFRSFATFWGGAALCLIGLAGWFLAYRSDMERR
jgi:hypothetical protein